MGYGYWHRNGYYVNFHIFMDIFRKYKYPFYESAPDKIMTRLRIYDHIILYKLDFYIL
jgi:hypothetical protein